MNSLPLLPLLGEQSSSNSPGVLFGNPVIFFVLVALLIWIVVRNMRPPTRSPDDETNHSSQPPSVRSDNSTLPSPISRNLPTFLAAAGMCAAFFMPWMTIMGLGLSGSTLGKIGDAGQMAWPVLILAAITLFTHFTGPKRRLNIVTGIYPFVMLFYFASNMGSNLFQILGIGAWLTLGCGVVLIFAPVKPLQ